MKTYELKAKENTENYITNIRGFKQENGSYIVYGRITQKEILPPLERKDFIYYRLGNQIPPKPRVTIYLFEAIIENEEDLEKLKEISKKEIKETLIIGQNKKDPDRVILKNYKDII